MKKILISAAMIVLIAFPLFAAARVKKAAIIAAPETTVVSPSGKLDVTTITKEMSQNNYPGVLVPGSMIGTDVFISDINLISNIVLLEVVWGAPVGMVSLKTDIGTIGISVAPGAISGLYNISTIMPSEIFGVQYGTKIGSTPVGFSILYGLDKYDYNNQNTESSSPPVEASANTSNQYVALKAGAGFGSLDIGATLSFLNNYSKASYVYDYGTEWYDDVIYDVSEWQLALNGRLALGNNMTAVVGLSYANGKDDYHYLDSGNDYIERYTNSTLGLNAALGKDIKAGETLLVKIAGGLNIGGYTNGKYEYIDNLDASSTETGTGSSAGDRTQWGWWTIPLNVAVEAKLNETWTLNAGTQANIVMFNNQLNKFNLADHGDDKIKEMYSETSFSITPGLSYSIGVSGKIGDLNLDLYMNPYMLIMGPHFISGNSLSGPMAGSVALKYEWK